MARSIHTTKRDLVRERCFAATDEVSDNNSITELEVNHLKKVFVRSTRRGRERLD
jgi:hypothetical protein